MKFKFPLGTRLKKEISISNIVSLEYSNRLIGEAIKILLDKHRGNYSIALNSLDLNTEEGPVKGSTFYFRNEIADIIRGFGYDNAFPIGPRESAIAIANNFLYNYKETYEDLGLVIYPKAGSNPKIWKDLREQIQICFKNINLEEPIIITGLVSIIKNDNYEHGLRLLISDKLTTVENMHVLGSGNGEFNSNDPSLFVNGFPSYLDKKGDKYLSTSDNGVCRLIRTIFLDIYARDSRLDFSTPAGRTHLIKY